MADLRRSSALLRAHERTLLVPTQPSSPAKTYAVVAAACVVLVGGSVVGYRAVLVAASARTPTLAAGMGWPAFKDTYGKTYESAAHEARAKQNFETRVASLAEANARNGRAAVFGVTAHADREAGAQAYARGRVARAGVASPALVDLEPVERRATAGRSVDWRADARGVVGPVKNQGQCGTCWAFAATEQVEAALVLAGSPPVELSPQQLASCATREFGCCDGCGGGDVAAAYEYLRRVPGLAPEAWWPYAQALSPDEGSCESIACTQRCDRDVRDLPREYQFLGPYAKVSGFGYATPKCEEGACDSQDMGELAARLERSPVAVCLNAETWDDYVGGVMTAAACGGYGAADVDHCVQLVGYNATAADPYWIVRNSWSSAWGEDGYAYLALDGSNPCGLANEATVVRVAEGV